MVNLANNNGIAVSLNQSHTVPSNMSFISRRGQVSSQLPCVFQGNRSTVPARTQGGEGG